MREDYQFLITVFGAENPLYSGTVNRICPSPPQSRVRRPHFEIAAQLVRYIFLFFYKFLSCRISDVHFGSKQVKVYEGAKSTLVYVYIHIYEYIHNIICASLHVYVN